MSIINKLVKQMVPVNVVKPLWYQAMVLSAVLLVGICAFLFFAGIRKGLLSGAYCPIVLSMHTFQWHVMPLLAIVFLGTLIFQCVFKAIQKSKSK